MYFQIFIAIIGLLFIFSSIRILKKSGQSGRWKKTKGIIKKSGKIVMLQFSEEIVPRKEPYILYEYLAKGKQYSNNKIFNVDNNTYLYKKTNDILKKYYKGKQVVVFYDYVNPEKSYLEQASMVPIWFTLLIGFVLALPSITLLLCEYFIS